MTARLLSSIAAALVADVAICGCSTDPGPPVTGPVPTSAEAFPPAHSSLELPASTIPSAEQVTEMLAAAFDYDLDLKTRVRLFEGTSLDTPNPVQQVAHTGEATLRATTVVPDGEQALAVSVVGTGAPAVLRRPSPSRPATAPSSHSSPNSAFGKSAEPGYAPWPAHTVGSTASMTASSALLL